MKRFKRQAAFLATNLETLVMVPFLVPGPCSTKCYLSALFSYQGRLYTSFYFTNQALYANLYVLSLVYLPLFC